MTEQLMQAILCKLDRIQIHITCYMRWEAYPGRGILGGELWVWDPTVLREAAKDVSRCRRDVGLEWRGLKDSWL